MNKMEPSVVERAEGGILDIGDKVTVRPFATIIAKKEIHIGDGTQIAGGVTIVDHDHDMDPPMENIVKTGKCAPVFIGKYCWIGANAVITKGVTLEDGCVVGAGTVVMPGVYKKGSIIVGIPGKAVATRFT